MPRWVYLPLNTSAFLFLFLDIPQLDTLPADTSIYASTAASRLPPQDSRPGGSLLLYCETLSFSAACRLSGKAMARTGLRMMPTFPSSPLKFRTAGFPRYGLKAGMSGEAFPVAGFAFVLRAGGHHRDSLLCVRGSGVNSTPPCERFSALPQGPSLRPGYSVPALSA